MKADELLALEVRDLYTTKDEVYWRSGQEKGEFYNQAVIDTCQDRRVFQEYREKMIVGQQTSRLYLFGTTEVVPFLYPASGLFEVISERGGPVAHVHLDDLENVQAWVGWCRMVGTFSLTQSNTL